jgi:hypothetical protein
MLVASQFRRVSEQSIIENALKLANMRDWRDWVEVWQTLGSRGGTATHAISETGVVRDRSGNEITPDASALADMIRTFEDEQTGRPWRELFEEDYLEYQREQSELVGNLEKIRTNIRKARTDLAPIISDRIKGLIVITIPEFRGGKLQLDPRPYAPDIRTACAFAVALLLDPSHPTKHDKRCFGERLRRCAYGMDEDVPDPCQNWFLSYAAEKGGPMPKYCCPEHRHKAADITAPARASKSRKSRAAKAKRKRI